MNFETIQEFDIPAAWRKIVSRINKFGDILEIKVGSECVETKKLSVAIIIDRPETRPLVDDKCITTNLEKVQEYALRYLWIDSKTPDEEYTYGSRLRNPVDQIQKAIELTAKEFNNRQITMTVRLPTDIDSPHPPCLTMIDLEVLENHLNLYGYFRSWDAYAGFPENIAGLQLFAEAFVNEVNELRKFKNPVLHTGKLIFFSKNCHLYKRQYEWADKLELNGQDSRRMVK